MTKFQINFDLHELFGYVLLSVLIFILSGVLSVYLKYRGILKWFNDGKKLDENKLNYSLFINFFGTMTGTSSKLVYNICKFFTKPQAVLNLTQAWFLNGEILPYQTFIDPSTGFPFGVLTPRAMCVSIKPYPNTGDQIFDDWYNTQTIYDINEPLTWENDTTPRKNGSGKIGIYPSTSDSGSWANLILSWLNQSKKEWKIIQAKSGTSNLITFGPLDDKITPTLNGWYYSYEVNGEKSPQPANFFARYGIGPNSPLIIYCINNRFSINGLEVDTVALQNLVGPDSGQPILGFQRNIAGGWVGYLKGMGDDASFDHYKSYIRSVVDFQFVPESKGCDQAGKTTAMALAGVAAGGSWLAMAAGPYEAYTAQVTAATAAAEAAGGTAAAVNPWFAIIGCGLFLAAAGFGATSAAQMADPCRYY